MMGRESRWMTDVGGVVACAVLVAAVYGLGVRPWLSARAEHAMYQDQVASLSSEVEEYERVTMQLALALATVDRHIEAETVTMRDASQLTDKLTELGLLAEDHGLVIDTMNPGKAEEGGSPARVSISLRGVGRYLDVARFLNEARDADRAVAVRAMQLSRGGEDGAGRFELELVWFVSGR